jgi:hypothetical protein
VVSGIQDVVVPEFTSGVLYTTLSVDVVDIVPGITLKEPTEEEERDATVLKATR